MALASSDVKPARRRAVGEKNWRISRGFLVTTIIDHPGVCHPHAPLLAAELGKHNDAAMTRVLLTAFKPYDRWPTNASWLALVELTKNLPATPEVTTRLYDVDFDQIRGRLAEDLADDYDYALHIGQAPGATRVQLEAVGINVAGRSGQLPDDYAQLDPAGPTAYRSRLPLARLAEKLREANIPAQVSYHAGTYLCNATLYLSHHEIARQGLATQATFIHLPLDVSQVMAQRESWASLPAAEAGRALRLILEELA
jgi:pyroglutamyl-peptidase